MKKFIIPFIASLLIIVVNPLHSQKLKNLGIQLNTTTYNFGEIQVWENQPAIFELTNLSKRNISILPLFSETDLEVIYPEGVIKPNETVIIKAIYYTSGTGSFTRKFPIYLDFSADAIELKITGNIKSLSPTAYIQCPQSKPEHSKSKVDLVGVVLHETTEIPIEGAFVEIQSVGSKTNSSLVSDKIGNFGAKLPVGNYQIMVKKEGFEPHNSFFYLGQHSGYLKIKLKPIIEEVIAQNIASTPYENKPTSTIEPKKEDVLETQPVKSDVINRVYETENIATKEAPIEPSKVKPENPQSVESEPTDLVFVKDTVIPKQITFKETPPDTVYSVANTLTNNKPTVTAKEEPSKPKVPIKVSVSNKNYTVRVIDNDSYQEIPQANVIVNNVGKKNKLKNEQTSDLGLIAFLLPEDAYELSIDAPNYISNSIIIAPDDDGRIIRVYLEPMSGTFEKLYEAKKEALSKEDILSQLSYGSNKLSFNSEKVDEFEIEEEATSEPKETIETPEDIPTKIVEEQETAEITKATLLKQEPKVAEPIKEDNKQQAQLDSIQLVLAKIETEKAKMELELAKANLALSQKENELTKKELELVKKDAALNQTSSQLEETKLNLAEQEKALETAKDSLASNTATIKTTQAEKEESIELSRTEYAANNVLFLIDISSSMSKGNKMELLKESMKNLAAVLRDIDKVAIIAYNQKTNVILEGVTGADKNQIIAAIDSLETYGLTYGVRGLQTAYDLLNYHYIGDGNNQIILATDGLFSKVNATMTERELNKEVEKKAKEMGFKLSVVGFGQDEEADKLMQNLADYGEGQYIKINNPWEARTVLIDEIKLNSKR